MTDNSNAAPELIWAWPDNVEDGFMAASRVNEPPTDEYAGGTHTEYTRADLASAQIAAAYEAAASKVATHMLGRNKEFADRVVAHVRALTPDDAKAKLAAMLKAERAKARDAVCKTKVVNDFCEGWCQDIGAPGDYDDCSACQIERAVRALAQEDGE